MLKDKVLRGLLEEVKAEGNEPPWATEKGVVVAMDGVMVTGPLATLLMSQAPELAEEVLKLRKENRALKQQVRNVSR